MNINIQFEFQFDEATSKCKRKCKMKSLNTQVQREWVETGWKLNERLANKRLQDMLPVPGRGNSQWKPNWAPKNKQNNHTNSNSERNPPRK